MDSSLEHLFRYNHTANQRYIMVFEETDALSMPDKAVELFSHTLNAHSNWLARIQKSDAAFGVWQNHEIKDFSRINNSNYEMTLPLIDLQQSNLDREVHYQNSKGEQYYNSVRDILLHIINHSTYHRAQIATILKESEVKVPNSDYIFFMREGV
jgi:uncharacterized damage-inducible protein DinB